LKITFSYTDALNDFLNSNDILENKTSIEEIAPKSAIYFLFNNDEIVYIGKSSDVIARIKNHLKDTTKKFTHYSIIGTSLETIEQTLIENELIMIFKPKYNTALSLPFKSIQKINGEYNINSIRALKKEIKINNIKTYHFNDKVFLHTLDISNLSNFFEQRSKQE